MVRRLAGPSVRWLAASLVLAGAPAAPAAAQSAPWQAERITAGWVFTPSIAFGGLWDSNVTMENDPQGLDPEVAEWVGIVNPSGSVTFTGRRARFNACYSGVLEAYQTLDELTRYEQRGRAEASYQMTPRLLFQTRHQLSATPTTDTLDLAGLPFTRVGSRLVTSGGGLTADLTRRMKLSANYAFQWVNFERDPRFTRLRGGHQHSPSAELTYGVTRRLQVGALWQYNHASIDGAEEVFDTQQLAAVATYTLTQATTIRGTAGVAHLRVSGTEESRTGPSYGASLSHLVRQTRIDAGYERSFVPSFGFGGMTASQQATAGVGVPFMQGRLTVGGSFAWRRTTPVLSTSFPIELTSYYTTGTVGYGIARWLRLEAFYRRTHQASSAQGNLDRHRVGVQFVTLKPVRIQ
jgi:hypothetical protein